MLFNSYAWNYGAKFCLTLLVLVLLTFSHGHTKDVLDSKTNQDELAADYIHAAFANGNTQLRKFKRVKPLTISFECLADNLQHCGEPIDIFQSTVSQTDKLQLLYMKQQSEFHLIFAQKNRFAELQIKLEKSFQSGIFDTSATDCQLFVNLQGATIINSVVVISIETKPERIMTCLLVNFYRAIGLSLDNGSNFAAIWGDSTNAASTFAPNYFDELKYRIDVLLYIHSCPRLQAGMSQAEVEKEINSGIECLRSLTGDSKG